MTRVLGDGWLVPALEDLNRAFFTRGSLVLRQCADCALLQHPPDEVCGGCQGTTFREFESAGLRRIESVVIVSLDDAPSVHLVGNVLAAEPGELAIGQAVEIDFEEIVDPAGGESLRIPQWRLR